MKKRMNRRDFLRLSATAAAGGVLAACGGDEPEKEIVKETVVETVVVEGTPQIVEVTAPPAEKVSITWWHGWGGMTGVNAMQAVADAFNKESDSIYVERLQVENVHEQYMVAIAGGQPPDCEIGNLNYSVFWARDVVYVVDDWVAVSTIIDVADYLDAALEGGRWQGKMYGVPCIESSVRFAFSYNEDLVKEAGLDPDSPPQTWDEAYDWHEAITTFDSAGNLEILGFDPKDAMGGSGPGPPDPFFWPPSYGLTWWESDPAKFSFDDERFVAALEVCKKFYDLAGAEQMAGYRSSYGTWTQSPTSSFPAGVQAMIINGPWQPGELARSAPDKKFRYTWGPTPSDRKGTKFQATGGHYGSIPLGSGHPEEAFKFLEFCTLGKVQDIVFDQTGWLGPRKSWNAALDVSAYSGLDFYINSIEEADEMWPSAGCPISGFVGDQWWNNFDNVVFGDKTPQEAANDMQEACTEELRKQFPDLA